MKDQITERLGALQAEYEAGQRMLADLEARRASLANTLLRIEGAIAVLKELGGDSVAVNGAPSRSAPPAAALPG